MRLRKATHEHEPLFHRARDVLHMHGNDGCQFIEGVIVHRLSHIGVVRRRQLVEEGGRRTRLAGAFNQDGDLGGILGFPVELGLHTILSTRPPVEQYSPGTLNSSHVQDRPLVRRSQGSRNSRPGSQRGGLCRRMVYTTSPLGPGICRGS